MYESKTYIAVPPGATIKEQLGYRNIKQTEFALRMGMSEKHISNLINGKVELTPDVANRLESVFGIEAKIWLRLEGHYRAKLAKVNEENEREAEYNILKKIPVKEMERLGWLQLTPSKAENIEQLRSFFKVARLTVLNDEKTIHALYRQLKASEKNEYSRIVWTQKVLNDSQLMEVGRLNLPKIKKLIPFFKSLTLGDFATSIEQLKNALAENGVALVVVPHLQGSYLHGVTLKSSKRATIGLTLRNKDASSVWFSFFHELGHLLSKNTDNEHEADEFARNTLINKDDYSAFTKEQQFTPTTIQAFAQTQKISTGLIIGRLQKDGYIPYSAFNDLKQKI